MNYMQQCPKCYQYWWDVHVCPKVPAGDITYLPPATYGVPPTKPEQISRTWTEEEIRAIIADEINKALSRYVPRSEMRF